jgi:hypothetical protein
MELIILVFKLVLIVVIHHPLTSLYFILRAHLDAGLNSVEILRDSKVPLEPVWVDMDPSP